MTSSSTESPGRRRATRLAIVGVLLVVGCVGAMALRGKSDATLSEQLIGTWKAADPSNAVLHRREAPVASETVVFAPDGVLTYLVELESNIGDPEKDLWEWKVHKGRVYLRLMGDEAGGQWLPGFRFSVSKNDLVIRLDEHPPKKFTRS